MDIIKILLPFYAGLFTLFLPILILCGIGFAVLGIILYLQYKEYKNSTYYKTKAQKYLVVRSDKGLYGEYLTYKHLKSYENLGAKFLFNVYIPKENGETSEIDVLMLSPKGVFVFESKNYSGWIFGSESQRNWYQTLPTGRGRSHKEHFYNPIMQNRSHIKHLKAFAGDLPTVSVIVFSERCTLKSITVKSCDIKVIKRNDVLKAVSSIYSTADTVLSAEDINALYEKLYPLTQVDDTVKTQHIESINAKHSESVTPETNVAIEKPEADKVHEAVTAEAVNTVKGSECSTSTKTTDTPSANEGDRATIDTPPMICPRCGKELLLRTATRGTNAGKQFYGCSGFPKCRYIQNTEE